MHHTRVALFAALLVSLGTLGFGQVQNITQGTGPYADLQSAQDAANPGDVLVVEEDLVLPSDTNYGLGIDREVTIRSDGTTRTITAGTAYPWGAAVLCIAPLTMEDLVIDGGGHGIAGIRAIDADVVLQGVTISNLLGAFQVAGNNQYHVLEGSTLSGAQAGLWFLTGSNSMVELIGSTVMASGDGILFDPPAEDCTAILRNSQVVGSGARGIYIQGANCTVVGREDSLLKDNTGAGVVVEANATGAELDFSETVFDNNGGWHILIGNGGGPHRNLILDRVTLWGGANGSNGIGGFEEMTADINLTIFANWAPPNQGINACCGFGGTISYSVMVSDVLALANVDPLVPNTVITSTVNPVLRTYEADNPFSVFFDTNPASPKFLTINADPKNGDQRVAAAHLIDEENNAGAKPVGGFVSAIVSTITEWFYID